MTNSTGDEPGHAHPEGDATRCDSETDASSKGDKGHLQTPKGKGKRKGLGKEGLDDTNAGKPARTKGDGKGRKESGKCPTSERERGNQERMVIPNGDACDIVWNQEAMVPDCFDGLGLGLEFLPEVVPSLWTKKRKEYTAEELADLSKIFAGKGKSCDFGGKHPPRDFFRDTYHYSRKEMENWLNREEHQELFKVNFIKFVWEGRHGAYQCQLCPNAVTENWGTLQGHIGGGKHNKNLKYHRQPCGGPPALEDGACPLFNSELKALLNEQFNVAMDSGIGATQYAYDLPPSLNPANFDCDVADDGNPPPPLPTAMFPPQESYVPTQPLGTHEIPFVLVTDAPPLPQYIPSGEMAAEHPYIPPLPTETNPGFAFAEVHRPVQSMFTGFVPNDAPPLPRDAVEELPPPPGAYDEWMARENPQDKPPPPGAYDLRIQAEQNGEAAHENTQANASTIADEANSRAPEHALPEDDEILRPGWACSFDSETGFDFYFHVDGTSQWGKPCHYLPDNWSKFYHEDDKWFYENAVTREVRWDVPLT